MDIYMFLIKLCNSVDYEYNTAHGYQVAES